MRAILLNWLLNWNIGDNFEKYLSKQEMHKYSQFAIRKFSFFSYLRSFNYNIINILQIILFRITFIFIAIYKEKEEREI